MTTEGAGGNVEDAIDELYRAPLDQFTAQRNALAVELRKAGDREGADHVKTLPKPGVTAWAVNQAWWREQAAFREMLDAGEALRSAYLALAKGQSADVRSAAEVRQRAVDRVTDAAVQALGGSGEVNLDTRHRIAGTVEALASSGVPPDVTVGRLAKDLQSSGLDALSALAGVLPAGLKTGRYEGTSKSPPPPRPVIVSRTPAAPGVSKAEARAEAKAEAAARDRAEKIVTAKAHLADRETALRAAFAEATTSASAAKKARAALDAAAAHVTALEQKLEAAHEEERDARRALTHATKAASEAEMIHARTARDVNGAREQLDALKETARRARE